MIPKAEFNPEHQFHVLLRFPDDERSVAVVPDKPYRSAGRFKVVDQGRELGLLVLSKTKSRFRSKLNISQAIVAQLTEMIKSHYYSFS